MRVSGIGEGVLFFRSYGPLCTWMYGMQVLQEQKPAPGPSRASSLALVVRKPHCTLLRDYVLVFDIVNLRWLIWRNSIIDFLYKVA